MKPNLIKYLNLADCKKKKGILWVSPVTLCWLWPNSGHMTDTGECEGQRGCQAPEGRKRKLPSSLEITQAHCDHSVGTETHTGFLPTTASYRSPNLNRNRPTKELIQQECFSLNPKFQRNHVLPKSTVFFNWLLLLSIHILLTHIF